MKILVIDGQGGNVGSSLTSSIVRKFPDIELTCVGTNSKATENMLKSGARRAATGENAVVVACRRADVIIGPLGIVIADSLFGEVTEKMAVAVARSSAIRILIPFSRCETVIAGLRGATLQGLVDDALAKLSEIIAAGTNE